MLILIFQIHYNSALKKNSNDVFCPLFLTSLEFGNVLYAKSVIKWHQIETVRIILKASDLFVDFKRILRKYIFLKNMNAYNMHRKIAGFFSFFFTFLYGVMVIIASFHRFSYKYCIYILYTFNQERSTWLIFRHIIFLV